MEAAVAGQVGRHGRLPVGACGHQPDAVKPAVRGDGAEEARDLITADVAQGQRRHVQDCVVA